MLPPHTTVVLASAAALLLGVGGFLGVRAVGDSASPAAASERTAAGAQWVAGPRGSGTDCTTARPCSAEAALAKAAPGDEVVLQAGSHPVLRRGRTAERASAAAPVLVRPAAGADVTLAGLSAIAPGVTVQGVKVTGTVYVNRSAVGTVLRDLHVQGSGVTLRADGSQLLDSLVEGGDSIDGVQIKDGRGILVQGNTVRDFSQLHGPLHADCVQIFDASDVVVRANTLHDCDNASVIFSVGAQKGIRDVLVESNFIGGCRDAGPHCKRGTAIDLREKGAVGVVVRNNTFAGGSVRIDPLPGLVVDRNVFGFLSSCRTPMTNSVVRSWNTGLCRAPAQLGVDGNRQGAPTFPAADAVDFHVPQSAVAEVSVEAVAVSYPPGTPPARDIDGQVLLATTAGADEPLAGGSAAAPPRPSAPPPSSAPALVVEVAPVTGVRSGSAVVSASVSGGRAASVDFTTGGRTFARGASTDGGRTWTATVDVRRLPAGTYSVTAVATGTDGRVVSSAPASAVVPR